MHDKPCRSKCINRVPVEAYRIETDGHVTHCVLHIIDRVVKELQVFTDILDEPHRHPKVDQLIFEINNGPVLSVFD